VKIAEELLERKISGSVYETDIHCPDHATPSSTRRYVYLQYFSRHGCCSVGIMLAG
jgi:hypothetical protein